MTHFAVIALFVLMVQAPVTPPANVTDLSWMSGCWTMTTGARTVTEFWLPPAAGTMLGMSRTVANGKTVEYEFVTVRTGAQGLEYVARPSGQPEAIFKASRVSPSEVVFENPRHDFPTRITYRRADDGLKATIDGVMAGKPRVIEFPYVPGNCSK